MAKMVEDPIFDSAENDVPSCTSEPPKKKRRTQGCRTKRAPKNHVQHHRIMTRSRTRAFPFTSLPPEIRNIIYEQYFEDSEPIPLRDLRLPSCLLTSRMFYIEARPLFFLSTPIAVYVRCNWCVRHHHLHSAHHQRFEQTGILRNLPNMLTNAGGELSQRKSARFSEVIFRIECCCCDQAKMIATMTVRVLRRERTKKQHVWPVVEGQQVLHRQKICPKIVGGLEKMFEDSKAAVAVIGERKDFNGLAVEDLETVAMCFRESECDSDLESEDA